MISKYAPLVKKLIYKENILVERVLPNKGYLNAKIGETIEPYQKIGTCRVVYEKIDLGINFKPASKKVTQGYVPKNTVVGKVGKNKFISPFNGKLTKNEQGYFAFESEERDYWLLPGVWGTIKETSENRSVLIETQVVNIHVPITTKTTLSGELIVFPNPSEMLSFQYFNNYLKSPEGKLIYVGNTVNIDIMQRAKELNVGAIFAGSATKEVYDYAIKSGISLGLFSAYGGELDTPDIIFNFLNNITNRFVFFHGDRNTLQIPIPPQNEFKTGKKMQSVLIFIKKGLKVQIFDSKHFGKTGVVDSATKSGILVRLNDSEEVVKVDPPNILAVD